MEQSSYYVQAINAPISVELSQIECNCVRWAKMYLGREDESWGIAGAIRSDTNIPWPGYLVLTNEGEFGHLGVIQRIEGSKLYIVEANYEPCVVSTRVLTISDPRIRGYKR